MIASLALILSMQLLVQSGRVEARITQETAARDLARRLLAENSLGAGQTGDLIWQVQVTPQTPGLALRQVEIRWPGGRGLSLTRLEVLR